MSTGEPVVPHAHCPCRKRSASKLRRRANASATVRCSWDSRLTQNLRVRPSCWPIGLRRRTHAISVGGSTLNAHTDVVVTPYHAPSSSPDVTTVTPPARYWIPCRNRTAVSRGSV